MAPGLRAARWTLFRQGPCPDAARVFARNFAIVALATISACGGDRRADSSALRPGDVARVGGIGIPGPLIVAVGQARAASPHDALGALIEDALLANAARDQGVETVSAARWAETAALSRRVLERIRREAHEEGPPKDDELASLTVVHAVVIRSTILTDIEAAGLASAIRDGVLGANGASDFERRASAVPHPKARVAIEHLSPLTADGVMVAGGGLDPTFVAAAFALHGPNEMSPVVETTFGWHVIMLVDRRVPEGDTLKQRREDLAEAVSTLRGRMAQSRIIASRRDHERVEIAGPAAALMATVQVESE